MQSVGSFSKTPHSNLIAFARLTWMVALRKGVLPGGWVRYCCFIQR